MFVLNLQKQIIKGFANLHKLWLTKNNQIKHSSWNFLKGQDDFYYAKLLLSPYKKTSL